MCVALPGIVTEVSSSTATVDFNGNKVHARIGFVDVNPGDHVLVHAGCILQRVTKTEAEELSELFEELNAF